MPPTFIKLTADHNSFAYVPVQSIHAVFGSTEPAHGEKNGSVILFPSGDRFSFLESPEEVLRLMGAPVPVGEVEP